MKLDDAPEVGTGEIAADLPRRLVAEALGTCLLIVAVIGSGIMASRLSPDDVGLQLLENAAATAAALVGLILVLGPISGAHLNPIVTIVDRAFGTIGTRDGVLYVVAQVVGGCLGAVVANVMFELPAVQISGTARSSPGLWVGEVVATAGLVLVILMLARTGRAALSAVAVASWIGAAYWFTSSTSFANPAVTVGRIVSDTFAGIAPASVPAFVLAQLLGGALGATLAVLLWPDVAAVAGRVVVTPDTARDAQARPTG